MSKKNGQARVLSSDEVNNLFEQIQKHRHPEKNNAIMEISFKLGLRAQEISLLEMKEVCELYGLPGDKNRQFKIHKVMTVPASYTKGANAMKKTETVSSYKRKVLSFSVSEFDRLVHLIAKMAQSDVKIEPSDFYPEIKLHKGKSRDLALQDVSLRKALELHLSKRLDDDKLGMVSPSSPLFLSQKGTSYSPNTLQEHMSVMLRKWAGVEKSSSHSGRRTLLTDIIHNQAKPISVAQKIAGHVSPATTLIYAEASEVNIVSALTNLSYGKLTKKNK